MDYHKADLHMRMLSNITPNVEIFFNNNDLDI